MSHPSCAPALLTAPSIQAAVAMAQGGNGRQASPWGHLVGNFAVGPTDLSARGFRWYKPAAVRPGSGIITGGRLRIVPNAGGAGPTSSWWYSLNPGFAQDGMLAWLPIVGTGWSARARMVVSNEAGDDAPPGGPGIWTFGGLGFHNPTRPPYSYLHAALGTDPFNARGLEAKTTDDGVSVYPVTAATGSGPIAYDVRVDRDLDDPQVFRVYFRPTTPGVPLVSDDDWELALVINRDDDTEPVRASAEPLPLVLQMGFMVYSNTEEPDVMLEVLEYVTLPQAA